MDPRTLFLIPLLPFVAGVVCSLVPKSARQPALALALAGIGGALVVSVGWFATTLHAEARVTADFAWLVTGDGPLVFSVVCDHLAALMVVMVAFVAMLVAVYSHGYMHDDKDYPRFFGFLAMFTGGMLGVCVANSLVLLFLSWEMVGLCSYLLIGFWYEKPSAAAAAKKAFLVTKLGDIGFFLGMLGLYAATGTQLFYDGGAGLLEGGALALLTSGAPVFLGLKLAGVFALLLFCGAVGKSGQFPLHVWLPDAMEGPTPVSALIHAATMVAAGVFLVARTYPLFAADPGSLEVVTAIGAFTALFAACIAVAQNDIKRILAYSTVSQLGLMMVGLGVAGPVAGMFHLLTHAFFKALLFLGAGSVIHACGGEQDIRNMGGLRGPLRVTFATYLVGALALGGVFPLAGFFSKDAILHGALASGHRVAFAMALAASVLTAFYMTRQVVLVFFGAPRSHAYHPHESPAVMLAPLVVLAAVAVGIGWLNTPWTDIFQHYLEPAAHPEHASAAFFAFALCLPLPGIAAGVVLYRRSQHGAFVDPLARLGALWSVLERRLLIDELYAATVVRALHIGAMAAAAADGLILAVTKLAPRGATQVALVDAAADDRVIRAGARRFVGSVPALARLLARVQNGRLQDTLHVVSLGAVIILTALFFLAFAR